MKTIIRTLIMSLILVYSSSLSVFAKEPPTTKTSEQSVVVTYNLHKIPTHGSNQVAIWVEDASGKFVRTLFVTEFTSKGGYIRRPSSLKTWVEKSNWKAATENEIDALSSATPKAGVQKIVWDCKDAKGKALTSGTYTICMEGNLRSGKMMYAKALVNLGKGYQKVSATLSFIPEEGKAEPLFENVIVEYKK